MAVQASTADGRAIFTVTPDDTGWAVAFEGEMYDHSRDKQEALAAAHRRARACHDSGRAAQVTISGEVSFAPRADARRR